MLCNLLLPFPFPPFLAVFSGRSGLRDSRSRPGSARNREPTTIPTMMPGIPLGWVLFKLWDFWGSDLLSASRALRDLQREFLISSTTCLVGVRPGRPIMYGIHQVLLVLCKLFQPSVPQSPTLSVGSRYLFVSLWRYDTFTLN